MRLSSDLGVLSHSQHLVPSFSLSPSAMASKLVPVVAAVAAVARLAGVGAAAAHSHVLSLIRGKSGSVQVAVGARNLTTHGAKPCTKVRANWHCT